MKALLLDVKKSLMNLNAISRTALRIGFPICLAAFSACILLYMAAGQWGSYDTLVRWSGELAVCAHDSLTALIASALIGEIIIRAGLPPSK